MSNLEFNSPNTSIPESENWEEEITPWKKAIHRILIGLSLSVITLNFWCLDYILPTVGMILMLLGFRTLRCENKSFHACFVLAVLRTISLFILLIANTTILFSLTFASRWALAPTICNMVLLFAEFFCFWHGLCQVQKKIGVPTNAKSVVALLIWYGVMCLLAIIQYSGWILSIALLIAYICIVRKLYLMSQTLDTDAIHPVPVKYKDRTVVLSLAAILVVGFVCGYTFGGTYPMDWKPVSDTEHQKVTEIQNNLIKLGFPQSVLQDIRSTDLAACKGAVRVVVDTDNPAFSHNSITATSSQKALHITHIAVQLPDAQKEKWVFFHHFSWKQPPNFYGTESFQISPAYNSQSWFAEAGGINGRLLYDKGEKSLCAPYYSLGSQTYTSSNFFGGEETNNSIFAAYSLPKNGENYRGYVSYTASSVYGKSGSLTSWSWICYAHQRSPLQYPVKVAANSQMQGLLAGISGPFDSTESIFSFHATTNFVDIYDY